MRVGAAVLAVLMLLTGGVWIGQGLGYIKGSFMTGDSHWFWIGTATVAGGLVVAAAVIAFRPAKKKTLP